MEIVTRKIHFYTCSKCGKARRSTLKDDVATNGICRKCRQEKQVEGQTSIFDDPQGASEYAKS